MRTIAALFCAVFLIACEDKADEFVDAYGAYSNALDKAREWAESPMAEAGAVVKMSEINDAPAMIDAQYFGEAYILCSASNKSTVLDFSCLEWDFTQAPIHSKTLRDGTAGLIKSKAEGERIMGHATEHH